MNSSRRLQYLVYLALVLAVIALLLNILHVALGLGLPT